MKPDIGFGLLMTHNGDKCATEFIPAAAQYTLDHHQGAGQLRHHLEAVLGDHEGLDIGRARAAGPVLIDVELVLEVEEHAGLQRPVTHAEARYQPVAVAPLGRQGDTLGIAADPSAW